MTHHTLDVHPIPKEKQPLYINEPWLIDRRFQHDETQWSAEPDAQADNIRIYIPLDLNKNAILQRLDLIIMHYEEANEDNESVFSQDVDALISQIEIYDQIWFVRHIPKDNKKHSAEAIELVEAFIQRLEQIPDGCAERFPFETIDTLREEYLKGTDGEESL